MPPACEFLVAPTGFEPATSALRGRRPKPLDDGATCQRCALQCTVKMAGVEGVEPSHTVPETAVLPLDDTPSDHRCSSPLSRRGASASEYITGFAPASSTLCNELFRKSFRLRAWHAETCGGPPLARGAPAPLAMGCGRAALSGSPGPRLWRRGGLPSVVKSYFDVRGIAERLVARGSAAAERVAVARLVRRSVRADERDAPAHEHRPAHALLRVLEQGDRRLQPLLEHGAASAVFVHEAPGRHSCDSFTASRLSRSSSERSVSVHTSPSSRWQNRANAQRPSSKSVTLGPRWTSARILNGMREAVSDPSNPASACAPVAKRRIRRASAAAQRVIGSPWEDAQGAVLPMPAHRDDGLLDKGNAAAHDVRSVRGDDDGHEGRRSERSRSVLGCVVGDVGGDGMGFSLSLGRLVRGQYRRRTFGAPWARATVRMRSAFRHGRASPLLKPAPREREQRVALVCHLVVYHGAERRPKRLAHKRPGPTPSASTSFPSMASCPSVNAASEESTSPSTVSTAFTSSTRLGTGGLGPSRRRA